MTTHYSLHPQLNPIPNPIFARMKVLMVCLGNICRSPLAEGILKHKAKTAGLDWEIDSAGTGGYHIGEAPHLLSQKVAKLNGIDISKQVCRQFKASDMNTFDLIYVMDHNNYNEVRRISGNLWNEEKTKLILDEVDSIENAAVPDPWYGTEKDYHHVFELLSNACEIIIQKYA